MNQGHQGARGLTTFDVMVAGDNLNDVVAQVPFFGQSATTVTVSKSHGGEFGLMERNLAAGRPIYRLLELRREGHAVHEDPDIVHEARHIGLVTVHESQFFGELSTNHRTT